MPRQLRESSTPLSVSEVLHSGMPWLDLGNADKLTRAYDAVETLTKCLNCGTGMVKINIDGTDYRVPCPLLSETCPHGKRLVAQLETRSVQNVKNIARLPLRFHERLDDPQRTDAIRGVGLWSYDPKCFLTLTGGHGTGKSFAAAHALVLMETKKLMVNWRIPASWGISNSMWAGAYIVTVNDELFQAAQTAPLLVIDDLGCEEHTSRAKFRLCEIISERYNQKRPTVITCNDDLEGIKSYYGARFFDRIVGDGKAVYCGDESMRVRGDAA